MLVIKIDEENTPEIRQGLQSIVAAYNVVSFAWEDETTPPEIRSGATGKDQATSMSAAIDQVIHAKPR